MFHSGKYKIHLWCIWVRVRVHILSGSIATTGWPRLHVCSHIVCNSIRTRNIRPHCTTTHKHTHVQQFPVIDRTPIMARLANAHEYIKKKTFTQSRIHIRLRRRYAFGVQPHRGTTKTTTTLLWMHARFPSSSDAAASAACPYMCADAHRTCPGETKHTHAQKSTTQKCVLLRGKCSDARVRVCS